MTQFHFEVKQLKKLVKKKLEEFREKIRVCKELKEFYENSFSDLFGILELLDQGNKIIKNENYAPHSKLWIEQELLSFGTIQKDLVPFLENIQKSLKFSSKQTGVCCWYFNHLIREFVLYVVKSFDSRDNQKTAERINLFLNQGYKRSSGFGGRERKIKRKMLVAGEIKSIDVNRKIDTIVGVKARLNIYRKSRLGVYLEKEKFTY